jgi:putative oxidoreductase
MDGWLKFGYVLHNQTDTLYFLFEDYKVPLLPVKMAAWMCMSGELGFSILLALGLFTRFGALGLLVISGVIYHTDRNPLALYWALICATLIVHGAGKYSLDTLLCSRNKKETV